MNTHADWIALQQLHQQEWQEHAFLEAQARQEARATLAKYRPLTPSLSASPDRWPDLLTFYTDQLARLAGKYDQKRRHLAHCQAQARQALEAQLTPAPSRANPEGEAG